MSNESKDADEATKQITIIFLGLSLLSSIVLAFFKPEAAQTVLSVAAAIVTALAAVVKK